MKITHKEYPLAVVADSLDPPQIRKPGWHVTNLIYEGLAISQGKRASKFDGADDSGLMAFGNIWEAVARPWLQEYAGYLGYTVVFPSQDNPLEAELDGVLGNMDAQLYDGVCAVCYGLGYIVGYKPILGDIVASSLCVQCRSTGKRISSLLRRNSS